MSKSNQLFIQPGEGLKVRNPDKGGEHLPAEGAWVARNAYWTRRLRDGDVKTAKPDVQEVQVPRETGKSGAADVQDAQVSQSKGSAKANKATRKTSRSSNKE